MYIHKIQLGIDEELNENNDLSNELRDIMERARHLLCDIEFYVNATAAHKSDRPKILTIQQMSDILRFPKRNTETQADQIRVHSKFVKKRFESYINILLKRLQRPGSLKVETKSGGKKRKCAGKMGAKDQNALRKPNCRRKLRKNVELLASEPKTTPKMHHMNRKKNNSINQKFIPLIGSGNGGNGAQPNKQIVQIKVRGVNNKSINDINNQTSSSFNPQMKRRKLKLERLRNQERNFPRHRKNGNNIPVTTTTQSPLLN